MITKEIFIKDMQSVLNNINCSETNGFISYDSYWLLEKTIEGYITNSDNYVKVINLRYEVNYL